MAPGAGITTFPCWRGTLQVAEGHAQAFLIDLLRTSAVTGSPARVCLLPNSLAKILFNAGWSLADLLHFSLTTAPSPGEGA